VHHEQLILRGSQVPIGEYILNTIIETDRLVKRFGQVTAVDGVSLRVRRGEIYAFLGLNGAGKTTTIRLLLGMIKPVSGEARVLGIKIQPGEKRPWGFVGYMVETPEAYPELSVRENLEIMRRLRPGTLPKIVDDVIERLGLSNYADRRAGTLSHGNAQRLGLAKALMHHPELLILDEPANGLDPAGIVEIRNLLTDLANDEGVTIFMSSHILAEVSRIAQRVGIIHEGRLLQELNMDQLEDKRQKRLLIQTHDCPAACALLVAAGFNASLTPDDYIQVMDGSAIEHPEEVAERLVYAHQPPSLLKVELEDLEHYFLRLIDKEGGVVE
jgi:ABC-2 type transport system ATP-binding protein